MRGTHLLSAVDNVDRVSCPPPAPQRENRHARFVHAIDDAIGRAQDLAVRRQLDLALHVTAQRKSVELALASSRCPFLAIGRGAADSCLSARAPLVQAEPAGSARSDLAALVVVLPSQINSVMRRASQYPLGFGTRRNERPMVPSKPAYHVAAQRRDDSVDLVRFGC